ncbi:hypothetical protein A33Q_2315 [Indibacter alkaliphilus LW1]|uniref:Uncharacterized protein n=1 Tax=Indibacter alkaliphilus (strain CCUG 57479 / KCTC 22604 / LW1) TaxID=1189612 RepID=S2DHG3_INDAL|nr:hypothetical protein A33Q_2315 [Indibacter alkaliphilus LW1]
MQRNGLIFTLFLFFININYTFIKIDFKKQFQFKDFKIHAPIAGKIMDYNQKN